MPKSTPLIIAPPAAWLKQFPTLVSAAKRLGQAYANKQVVEDGHLEAIGSALTHALQLEDTITQAKKRCGLKALSIIIESDDAGVQSLPWETLHHPKHGFVGREPGFTLSRRGLAQQVDLPDIEAGPLRVLLFTSLPDSLDDATRLDVEAEQATVQEALMLAEQAGEILLEMPDDGRLENFQQSLQRFQPHIVYLSGHGQFFHEPHNNKAWGSFLFESEWGEDLPVDELGIIQCFQNTNVQLLVLSACLSAKQHPDFPENGLSQALYQAGIPHVIGMRESVFDKAATQFAKTLLTDISNKKQLGIALQNARQAIRLPLEESIDKDGNSPQRTQVSFGQWCLPQLLSHDDQRELIDWHFTAQAVRRPPLNAMLGQVSIPERFIGRRRELRRWQNGLRRGDIRTLLITGAGGTGKTALAGKLLDTLRKDDYTVFTFSLRPEHDWRETVAEMTKVLAKDTGEDTADASLNTAANIEAFLNALVRSRQHKLALFFDNLESIQQAKSPHALQDEVLNLWVNSAHKLSQSAEIDGLKLVLTSRWRLPEWPDQQCYALGCPVYGDYLAFARRQQLSLTPERMQRAYHTLGGNFRALEFFASAVKAMDLGEEKVFLNSLQEAETEIQTNMALAKVIAQRSAAEITLLHALLAYPIPIPIDGIKTLMRIADTPYHGQYVKPRVEQLLAVSLVEYYRNPYNGQDEYQLSPLVQSWLKKNGAQKPDTVLLQSAADFLYWQLEVGLHRTWSYRLATHKALHAAQRDDQAQQLVLDWIIGPLDMAGRYTALLEQWLPPLLQTHNLQRKGKVLGFIGKQHLHLGNYDAALGYLQQSLSIRQEIGDKSGEGTTLNNISQIYDAKGDYETALGYLQQSLSIQQEIGDKSGEGTTLNNISSIHHARGDYETALGYLQQSLSIRQEIGDKSGEGATLNNISQIYDAKGDYETALGYLQQSLSIQQEIGDKSGEGATLNNISQIYDAKGDYETALGYLQQSLSIQQEIGDKSGEGATLNNISQIYDAKGDYETALGYLQQSLSIQQEIGDMTGLCVTLFNIGHIHMQNEEQTEALQAWVTAYEIAKKIQSAQVLEALTGLAEQLDLPGGGLDGWEALTQRAPSA